MLLTKIAIRVGVSARHVHLSREHVDILFGKDYQLNPIRELFPGYYAARETVDITTLTGEIKGVRVLGPERRQTQVELAITDAVKLGLTPPVRESGDVQGSARAVLHGPQGVVQLSEGVIIAARHVHVTAEDGFKLGLQDGEIVRVYCGGERGLIFDNVIVRCTAGVTPPEMHIDTDEGNAAMLKSGDIVYVMKAASTDTEQSR